MATMTAGGMMTAEHIAREVQEESAEQGERHTTHHGETAPSGSGCTLAKSAYLVTHPHKQERRDKRMGKE